MKFGVVQFPGSNCERDCLDVTRRVLGHEAILFDYRETPNFAEHIDCLIIPGGFSYGDYLRAGAVAKASAIMSSIQAYAEAGGLVIGICNGFQILTEARLLPGALLNNKEGRFLCQDAEMRVVNPDTPFSNLYKKGEVLSMPVAHAQGNYTVSPAELQELKDNNQIVFEYTSDINGSTANIAGICNKNKNVFGLMPHPERCCENELGGSDGLKLFQSILNSKSLIASV